MPDPSRGRPDWAADLRSRLAGLDADPRRIEDIVDEVCQHLDDRYDELRSDGLDPPAARAADRPADRAARALIDQARSSRARTT